jgi:hypothetical protein
VRPCGVQIIHRRQRVPLPRPRILRASRHVTIPAPLVKLHRFSGRYKPDRLYDTDTVATQLVKPQPRYVADFESNNRLPPIIHPHHTFKASHHTRLLGVRKNTWARSCVLRCHTHIFRVSWSAPHRLLLRAPCVLVSAAALFGALLPGGQERLSSVHAGRCQRMLLASASRVRLLPGAKAVLQS